MEGVLSNTSVALVKSHLVLRDWDGVLFAIRTESNLQMEHTFLSALIKRRIPCKFKGWKNKRKDLRMEFRIQERNTLFLVP